MNRFQGSAGTATERVATSRIRVRFPSTLPALARTAPGLSAGKSPARWRLGTVVEAVSVAALLLVTPVLANSDLPPPQYDIGGDTEADALVAYSDRFGNNAPPIYGVMYGSAKAKCDTISLERFNRPYPASETMFGEMLLGCMIENKDRSKPEIVYTFDPAQPELAPRIIRHEVGHLLGWSHE